MVASGRGPTDRQIDFLVDVVETIKAEVPVNICVSVGPARRSQGAAPEAGGRRPAEPQPQHQRASLPGDLHARTPTPTASRRCAPRAPRGSRRAAALIVGMGEQDEDVVEVALELRALEVPSIPVNFLLPIEGNPRAVGRLAHAGARAARARDDAAREPARRGARRRRTRGPPALARGARALARELAVRRGLPHHQGQVGASTPTA